MRHVHFVGFTDNRYLNAVKVFGIPDDLLPIDVRKFIDENKAFIHQMDICPRDLPVNIKLSITHWLSKSVGA